jgi:hypothetical protein
MPRRFAAAAVALTLGVTWIATGTTSAAGAAASNATYVHACSEEQPAGFARCDMLYRPATTTAQAQPNVTAPQGYGPADLQAAYNLNPKAGLGRIVAVVDAGDLPYAESALATYRSTFGLPPCTTANGCFLKVNQDGDPAHLPTPQVGWDLEIMLDLDMVSAACPNCAIVLVEADDSGVDNLATAAATGASYAEVVSNSYSATEDASETGLDGSYSVPGVIYTASSGDVGFGPQYPAASPSVVAVGGTSLTRDSSTRGWHEEAWDGGGSGCSGFEPKPAWQSDSGCTKRTEVDISAVSDPNTGVAVYGPFPSCSPHSACWGVAGGTSAAAPLIAGAYMVAAGTPVNRAGQLAYARSSMFNDITDGQNGPCGTYLCMAGAGYDGPTGLGTPNDPRGLRSVAGVAEFDAAGHTQISVWRPSNYKWWVRGSTQYPIAYGTKGDIPVPADYFGDTFTDPAMYRPSNNTWYILNLPAHHIQYGTNGDIPVPADYDGDGAAEIALFRPSNHTWYIRNLFTGKRTPVVLGSANDTPVPGDYNGDGKAEVASYTPSTSTWHINGQSDVVFGQQGDVPVPGDYDGDGKVDIAVFRPSTDEWLVQGMPTFVFGSSGDIPEPGDYDGDGTTDAAVRFAASGGWAIRNQPSATWGRNTDIPLVLPYAINRTR